jgi:hypothetical protein
MTNNNELTVEQINMVLGIQNDVRDIVQEFVLEEGMYSKIEEDRLRYYRKELNDFLLDPKATVHEKQAAIANLTQVEGFIDLFETIQGYGLDTTGMNASQVVLQASQRTLTSWVKPALRKGNSSDGSIVRAKDSALSMANKARGWLHNVTAPKE